MGMNKFENTGDVFTDLTDSSGGTASDTLPAISATYDQAEVRNSIASLAAKIVELHAKLNSANGGTPE